MTNFEKNYSDMTIEEAIEHCYKTFDCVAYCPAGKFCGEADSCKDEIRQWLLSETK